MHDMIEFSPPYFMAIMAAIKKAEQPKDNLITLNRCITIRDMEQHLAKIDMVLELSDAAKEGTIVKIDAYAGTVDDPEHKDDRSTHFDAVYLKGKWMINCIYRDWCNPDDSFTHKVSLSYSAIKALLEKFSHFI